MVLPLDDSILAAHETALRHAAVTALREWLADHVRTGVSLYGRPQVVPVDAVGQQIARALIVLGEPLHDLKGSPS